MLAALDLDPARVCRYRPAPPKWCVSAPAAVLGRVWTHMPCCSRRQAAEPASARKPAADTPDASGLRLRRRRCLVAHDFAGIASWLLLPGARAPPDKQPPQLVPSRPEAHVPVADRTNICGGPPLLPLAESRAVQQAAAADGAAGRGPAFEREPVAPPPPPVAGVARLLPAIAGPIHLSDVQQGIFETQQFEDPQPQPHRREAVQMPASRLRQGLQRAKQHEETREGLPPIVWGMSRRRHGPRGHRGQPVRSTDSRTTEMTEAAGPSGLNYGTGGQ